MKILVFSDSHGVLRHIETAILEEKPDYILHLGDYERDLLQIQSQFPHIPMVGVPGNCDYGTSSPVSKTITLDSFRIFMTHGHMYNVKYMYLRAIYAALEQEADILLFGHTHRGECFTQNNLHAMNPGAAKDGCYGIIETNHPSFYISLKTSSERTR